MWDGIELSRHVKVSRGVPGEKDIDSLHAAGIRTVLDLRTDGEFVGHALDPSEEAALLRSRGIAYRRRPLSLRAFTDADLEEIGAVLRDAEKPVLVHCAAGKRAGMVALAHTCVEAGVPGEEMMEMARSLDFVFGTPEQQHKFARYVDEHERRPGGHERRDAAAAAGQRVRPLLPEDVRTVRDELDAEHNSEHRLDRETRLRARPAPARPGVDDLRTRPMSQPGDVAPRDDPGRRPRVRRFAAPATVPASDVRTVARLPASPAGEVAVALGTPLGLATAGAVVGTVLLLVDRRLLVPVLLVAGGLLGRALVARRWRTEIVPEIAAADRAEDREVRELEARVEALMAEA